MRMRSALICHVRRTEVSTSVSAPRPKGRAFSHRDELRGLPRQQRQGNRADAFNLDQRKMQGALASRNEVAGRLHGLQDGCQRGVDRIHDRFPHGRQCARCRAIHIRSALRHPVVGAT